MSNRRIYSSGRLPNFFPLCAKEIAEIDSLATCESFLSLPFQVCGGVKLIAGGVVVSGVLRETERAENFYRWLS
jgi:hypothetical protein